MPPVAPYCSEEQVRHLTAVQHGYSSGGYQDAGTPSAQNVKTWIELIGSRIDQAYATAGYYIPFEVMTDDSEWPEFQTTFLAFFHALGVAVMTSTSPFTPAVTNFASGERTGRSWAQRHWDDLIVGLEEKIALNGAMAPPLIRAKTRSGSKANKLLSLPSPPLTGTILGRNNPAQYDSLREYTRRQVLWINEMREGFKVGSDPWSYDWLLDMRDDMGILADRQS